MGRGSPDTQREARPPTPGPSAPTAPACDNPEFVDPQRKRKIRLVVALSVAVLLAVALIYTSFSASTEAKEPSQLLTAAPGTSYEMTGEVVKGSIHHQGSGIAFRVVDRDGGGRSLPVTYTGHRPRPLPRRPRDRPHRRHRGRHLRRRTGNPDHQVPVEVHDQERCLASAARCWRSPSLTALAAAALALAGRNGDRRRIDLSRRVVYAFCGLLTACVAIIEIAFAGNDFSFNIVAQHSSIETPTFYKLAAMWSSQEGSLLLWAWVLSIVSSAALYATRGEAAGDRPLGDRGDDGRRRLLHRADAVRARRRPLRDA